MTLAFWKDAAVRAVKTFAQVVLALLGTGYVGITTLDWTHLLGVASTAALASVLTSVVSLSNVGAGGRRKARGRPYRDDSVRTGASATAPPLDMPTPESTPTV